MLLKPVKIWGSLEADTEEQVIWKKKQFVVEKIINSLDLGGLIKKVTLTKAAPLYDHEPAAGLRQRRCWVPGQSWPWLAQEAVPGVCLSQKHTPGFAEE